MRWATANKRRWRAGDRFRSGMWPFRNNRRWVKWRRLGWSQRRRLAATEIYTVDANGFLRSKGFRAAGMLEEEGHERYNSFVGQ